MAKSSLEKRRRELKEDELEEKKKCKREREELERKFKEEMKQLKIRQMQQELGNGVQRITDKKQNVDMNNIEYIVDGAKEIVRDDDDEDWDSDFEDIVQDAVM